MGNNVGLLLISLPELQSELTSFYCGSPFTYYVYIYIIVLYRDIHAAYYVYNFYKYIDTYMGLSENMVNIPNEIAIFHRDNDQQNHWL